MTEEQQQPITTQEPISAPAAGTDAAPIQAGATPEPERKLSPTESLMAAKRAELASKGTENKTGAPSDGKAPITPAGEPKPQWDGNFANIEALPPELQDKAKELQRRWTDVTTERADALKKADAYEQYLKSPEHQRFQEWQKAQEARPKVEIAGVQVDAEMAEAALTDPAALVSLVDRIAEAKVGAREEKSQQQQKLAETETQIAEYVNKTPDFWKLHDRFLPIMKEQMAKGVSIADATAYVRSLQQTIANEERTALQQRVQEKKAGVTLTPSMKQEPDIVWVDNQRDSYRVASELAAQGIRKEVRVKRK